MKFSCRFLAILAIYFFLTIPASAAVVINEIMYDLKEGSDTGREWIEIANTGTTPTTLTGWKLYEANTNHALTLSQGNETIPIDGFAIITSDVTKFLADNPGFSGTIFDSSFSLSNTGESLAIRDANLADIDSVIYTSDQGGAGDGNSLQKVGSIWQSGTPTPGASTNSSGSTSMGDTPSQGTSTTTASNTTTTSTGGGSSFPVEPQIFASAGEKKRTATVGGATTFSGRVWGLKKEPIENARMLWNFGDGSTAEGKTVLHTYRYPGTYIITLDASSGYYSASDRVTIEAVSADIVISSVGDSQSLFVELYNKSHYELDLSFWSIRADNLTFVIPEHTFVATGAKIKFAREVTGIVSSFSASVALYYPNGILAHAYSPTTSLNTLAPLTNSNQPVVARKTAEVQASNNQESIKSTILPQNTITKNEFPGENTQSASVGSAYPETSSLFWWIMGVCALVIVGIGSVFFTKQNSSLELAKNNADEYEIIEETEDGKIPF